MRLVARFFILKSTISPYFNHCSISKDLFVSILCVWFFFLMPINGPRFNELVIKLSLAICFFIFIVMIVYC